MATPDPQQVGLAQAIATGGTAGANAFKAAQSNLGQAQSAAVNSAATRAGLINAPAAFLQEQAAKVAQPYQAGISAAGNANAANNSYMSALNGAHANYLAELKAAAPLYQAQIDKQAAQGNADSMMKMLSQARAITDFQQSQQDRASRLADAQTKMDQKGDQSFAMNELNNPNSQYSPPTRTAAKSLISQAPSYADAVKSITTTTKYIDKNGQPATAETPGAKAVTVQLTPADWASKGVNMQDLLNVAQLHFQPSEYFQSHPSNPLFYSPAGTPGGADLRQ